MKKARLFTLFTAIVIFTLLLLGGCEQKETIESISIKDYDPSTTIETVVGEFNYEAYTLVVTYDSGRTEEIPLTAEMIVEADSFKFYQIGEHEIAVSYAKATCTLKVSIKRSTFGEISFPENNVFTYDGKEHTVEVQGDIPANAVVTYTGGNTFINAGSYDVTAIVSCEGYVTAKLSTTVKIERAKYDMSSIRFDAKEVVYDGQPHSIEISGTLPEGVSAPTYTINGQTSTGAIDVDEYTVTATFANNNPNYEPIPSMQTTLKITPAEYLLEDIDIVFKREDGQVIDGAVKTYDRSSVVFDLNDYSKLSNNVSVSFSVYDQSGKLISSSNKNTNIINVGVYTVKAEFTFADSKNYYPIEPIVSIFEVIHAEYKISDISFNSNYFKYDGTERSVVIDGKLPAGVSVSYEYYLDDTLLVDAEGKPVQSVTDAGEYTVKAIFSVADINFGQISPLTAKLKIDKIKIDLASLGVLDNPSVQYSGAPYEPNFKTWKEITGSDFDVLNYGEFIYYKRNNLGQYIAMEKNDIPCEVGFYRFVITISIDDKYVKNYSFQSGETSITYNVDFEIKKMTLDTPTVKFEGNYTESEYNGEEQPIQFTCNANADFVTVTSAYFCLEGEEYLPMEEGQIPTNAGSYSLVVTLTIKDATKYTFANGEATIVDYYNFKITKCKIYVSEFGIRESFDYNNVDNTLKYSYTGNEMHEHVFQILDQEKHGQYINYKVESRFVYNPTSKQWRAVTKNEVIEPGIYKARYTITIKDSNNYTLVYNSQELSSVEVIHHFEIV